MLTVRFHFPDALSEIRSCFAAITEAVAKQTALPFAGFMQMVPFMPSAPAVAAFDARGSFFAKGNTLTNLATAPTEGAFDIPGGNGQIWATMDNLVVAAAAT